MNSLPPDMLDSLAIMVANMPPEERIEFAYLLSDYASNIIAEYFQNNNQNSPLA